MNRTNSIEVVAPRTSRFATKETVGSVGAWGAVARVVALAVSTVATLGACSSAGSSVPVGADASTDAGAQADVGTQAGEGDGGSSEACAATLEGACGDCMKASCCDALASCEGDPDCAACVAGTDSEACERTEETHARVNDYLVCKGGACSAECIGGGAKACTGRLAGLVSDACATCMEESCCEEVSNCEASAVCWDGCFQNHDETKCHGAPDGHAVYHAMGACASKACAKVCK